MNKIVLTAAVLALTSGAALAENPNFGIPAELLANDSAPAAAAKRKVDYTAPASISTTTVNQTNPAANRFGDASPANQK